MTLVLGIDPGASGALVALRADGSLHGAWRTPATPGEMAALIRDLPQIRLAVLEKVSSRPSQGVVSVFTFGRNVGVWVGILSAFHVPMIEVTPQKWQGIVPSLPAQPAMPADLKAAAKAGDKAAGKALARLKAAYKAELKAAIARQAAARWPGLMTMLKVKANWGCSDASFLALYGISN